MSAVNVERIIGYRWVPCEVIQLIELVKKNPAIYNPKDKYYFCRPYVENIWRDIDIKLKKSPGSSLAKWTNLRICFRREYASFITDNVKPAWAYFDSMFFLHEYLRNRKRYYPERLESHIQEALEQINSITRSSIRTYVENIQNIEMYEESSEQDQETYEDSRPHVDDSEEEDYDDNVNVVKEEVIDDDCSILEERPLSVEPQQEIQDETTRIRTEGISNYKRKAVDINLQEFQSSKITKTTNHCSISEIENSKKLRKLSEFFNKINRHEIYNKIQNYDEIETLSQTTTEDKTSKCDKSSERVNNRNNHNDSSMVAAETESTSAEAIKSRNTEQVKTNFGENSQVICPTATATSSCLSNSVTNAAMCECKTDPDAMFLISLLPDIRSLSRKDKGKFKIEIQKLIQSLLYPDVN